MKTTCLSIVLGLFFIPLFAQGPELGLPGDNLNLYGVLNIFQNSRTLEEFEKDLNAENSQVNNLDLDGDGRIDYIHVVDNMNGSAHAIALRVDINESETQDVAVIEVEKDAYNRVHIQIVGDEALYGKDYIVEPNQSRPNPGYRGNVPGYAPYYSPETWAIIGYMFTPRYVVYESPYHWGYYPHYWRPWHPLDYHVFYGFHRPYYSHYSRSYVYHSPAAHAFYAPHRIGSAIVRERYHSPGTGLPPRPINNRPAGINHPPRPINNGPARTNQPQPIHHESPNANRSAHPINNQPARTNQPQPIHHESPNTNRSAHPINNQPARTNQPQSIHHESPNANRSAHPINNQPARTNQVQHSVSHQPVRTNSHSSTPAKTNAVKKK